MLLIRENIKNIKPEKGFTLIELVLSMALLSIVLAAAFNVYNYSINTYEADYKKMVVQQNARQALILLSKGIRQADTVEIISPFKINLRTDEGENIKYYLEKDNFSGKGVLYREKNKGKNPVAELENLNFSFSEGEKTVKIELSARLDDKWIQLRTEVTPSGQVYKRL